MGLIVYLEEVKCYVLFNWFLFSVLMLDPISPQPVVAVPKIAEDLSIKGMAFAGPSSSQLFDEWPETGEPYFLNKDSVKEHFVSLFFIHYTLN